MRKSVLAAAAALSMASMSGGAIAQSAAPLSLAAQTRVAGDPRDANEIRGGFILPALAIIVIGVLIYALTKGDGTPASP